MHIWSKKAALKNCFLYHQSSKLHMHLHSPVQKLQLKKKKKNTSSQLLVHLKKVSFKKRMLTTLSIQGSKNICLRLKNDKMLEEKLNWCLQNKASNGFYKNVSRPECQSMVAKPTIPTIVILINSNNYHSTTNTKHPILHLNISNFHTL